MHWEGSHVTVPFAAGPAGTDLPSQGERERAPDVSDGEMKPRALEVLSALTAIY